jgi:nucleoside-diphosphate kinase
MANTKLEQTLVLIKPDALKNSLTGYLLSQISEYHTGLYFSALKVLEVHQMLAEEHYTEHRGKMFFPSLLEYIMGKLHYPDDEPKRRVIAIIYEGPNAVANLRAIAGPTNPHVARDEKPGCIRALGTVVPLYDKDDKTKKIGQRMDNLIHGSATPEEAEREIKLWFKPNEMPPKMQAFPTEKSDNYYYYKRGELFTTYVDDSICLLAPCDLAWKSDLEILQNLTQGRETTAILETVAAKYLINEERNNI